MRSGRGGPESEVKAATTDVRPGIAIDCGFRKMEHNALIDRMRRNFTSEIPAHTTSSRVTRKP